MSAKYQVISTAGPTALEEQHTLVLECWCENTVEPAEEYDRRQQALMFLRTACNNWIRAVYQEEFNLAVSEDIGGALRTTGSYRYSAHSSGSDIDVVIIAPERMTMAHFTGRLPGMLRAHPQVTDMVVIAEARVPLVSMKIYGIDFDLSFGAIGRARVAQDIKLDDDRLLIGLTPQSTKAVNAVRVAEFLITSVPVVATFRQVLRFVKAWAKARGIYSFKIGFPSGIGWAVLCAKICQLYPNQNAAGAVFHFFSFYATWFKRAPTATQPNGAIFLTEKIKPAVDLRAQGVERSWNPQENMKDSRALFPVLTPAYPYQDACDNVSMSTLGVLCDEFARANDVVRALKESTAAGCKALAEQLAKTLETKRAVENECANPGEAAERGKDVMKGASFGLLWETLLQRYPFFASFTHFVRVTLQATNAKEFRPWVEIMETKIQSLWKEYRDNKGCALENWSHWLRIRPISSTFEDPAQADALAKAKKEMLLLQQQQQQQQQFGGGGGEESSATAAASGSGSGSSANPSTGEQSQQVFTAYIFVGIELLPGAKLATAANPNDGINFNRVITAFVELSKKTQARIPSALQPTVDIVRREALPGWLPGINDAPVQSVAAQQQNQNQNQQQQQNQNQPAQAQQQQQQQTQNPPTAVRRDREAPATAAAAVTGARPDNEAEIAERARQQRLAAQQQAQAQAQAQAQQQQAEREAQLKKRQQEREEMESLMGFDF